MHEKFEKITAKWFESASKQWTGSIEDRNSGFNFRYRFEHVEDKQLKLSTYSKVCYESAKDVEEITVPWTDEGAEQARNWYQAQYEKYCSTFQTRK